MLEELTGFQLPNSLLFINDNGDDSFDSTSAQILNHLEKLLIQKIKLCTN